MKTFEKISLISAGLLASLAAVGCGGSSSDDPTGFIFATDAPSAYTQIDRHAAVEAGTVGIDAPAGLGISPVRDLYNASNPVEDAAGRWVGEITTSVEALHATLDDDLTAAGLIPASVATSLAQAGPVIVPDIIRYNPDLPASYPNGRKLTDPVVDLTIAAAVLDLGQGGQSLTTLAGLPLNPPANDKEFSSSFPYLASPNNP